MDASPPFLCPACGEILPGVDPKRASHGCPSCRTVHRLGELLKNRRWDAALSIDPSEIPEDSYVTPGPNRPLPPDQKPTVDRYRLQALIGEGGMGKVFAAVDGKTGEPVAIKLIHRVYCSNQEFIQRFLREGSLLRNIAHKNLIRFLDLGLEEEGYFLAMSYVEGMNLKAFVGRSGPLPVLALKIAAQTARGLLEAHKNCIMHRDVKPDNVLLNRRGEIRVLDFGLARNILSRTTNLTVSGQILGTPAYMSPEQCDGKSADNRADIYALGATLFYALTGRPPFEGTNNFAIMYKHLNEPLPDVRTLNPAVSEACEDLLSKMMAKDRGDRYQTMERIVDDICLVLDEMSPSLSGAGDGTVLWTRFLDSPSSESVLERALRQQEESRRGGVYVPPLGELVAAVKAPAGDLDAVAAECASILACSCGATGRLSARVPPCPACGGPMGIEGIGRLESAGKYVVVHSDRGSLAYGDLAYGQALVELGGDLARVGRLDVVLALSNVVELGNDQFIWLFDLFEVLAPPGGSLGLIVTNERVHGQIQAVGADHYIRLFHSLEEFRDRVADPGEAGIPAPAGEFDWGALLTLALGRTRSVDPREAIGYYDGKVGEATSSPPAGERAFLVKVVAGRLTALGAAAMTEKRFRDARELLDRALDLLPDSPPTLLQLGRWFLLRQEFRKAAEYFTRALEIHPEFLPALEHRGGSNFYLDLKDRALEDFARALEVNPKSQQACYNMACVYAARDEKETALDWLERAVEFGWNDPALTENDEDLASLRDQSRFRTLIERLRTEENE